MCTFIIIPHKAEMNLKICSSQKLHFLHLCFSALIQLLLIELTSLGAKPDFAVPKKQ